MSGESLTKEHHSVVVLNLFQRRMDYKQNLMNEVIQGMLPFLNNAQAEKLQEVLQHTLFNYKVVENKGNEEISEKNLVELFLSAKRIEGCSEKSLKYYEATITSMLSELGKSVKHIVTDDIRTYLTEYQARKQSSKVTIDNIRRILSSFFSWLEDEDYILKSPVRRIHKVKTGTNIKETYTDEVLELMRDNCTELRDLAIIDMLASTGMRVGEMVLLNREDIDFNERECVVFGKGDTGELNICRQVYHVKGSMQITEPKTKSSIRTIILPKVILNVLAEYKKTVNSRWLFPSPMIEDMPRNPQSVYKKFKSVLERSGCKNIRFHDLRHTFATTALANGMDVKTLSSIIGHVSSQTTLDIYLHSTQEMRRQAAKKIDSGIGKNDGVSTEDEQTPDQDTNEPCKPKFEAVQGKIRKAGTGCLYQVSENLWEGSYFPRLADGKRKKFNVYAKTREECEVLLAEMIPKVKAEIAEAKANRKVSQSA